MYYGYNISTIVATTIATQIPIVNFGRSLLLGTRCVEIVGLGAASLLNLYIVMILAKQFQLGDSVWMIISVCKLTL